MANSVNRKDGWIRRKARVRKKITGTGERPRLNVYRSNKHMYAQLINDITGSTIASASTVTKGLKDEASKVKKTEAATKVGEAIGVLAKEKGITSVVFDRSGFLYHGRVKAVAEAARGAGLKF